LEDPNESNRKQRETKGHQWFNISEGLRLFNARGIISSRKKQDKIHYFLKKNQKRIKDL
jgi:hypothetical protein